MTAEDRPDPDLKAKNLLASAAPDSPECSDDDPALGNVNVTVEDADELSETTVRPLGSFVAAVDIDFPVLVFKTGILCWA